MKEEDEWPLRQKQGKNETKNKTERWDRDTWVLQQQYFPRPHQIFLSTQERVCVCVCVCVCVGVCVYTHAGTHSVTQSCLTLCDPMDWSPPGSYIHGIFQARILEWVVISCSRGSFWPRNQTSISWVSCIVRQILHFIYPCNKPTFPLRSFKKSLFPLLCKELYLKELQLSWNCFPNDHWFHI